MRKNPFLQYCKEEDCQYLNSLSSINRLIINKVPIKGIDDSIKGKTAHEIFRTSLVIEEIKKYSTEMKININEYEDFELPKFLDVGLKSEDLEVKKISEKIATKFGNRLGLIFLTLKTGLEENKKAREDWTDVHWEYWKDTKTIILVGGLASGVLGKFLKKQIEYVFTCANVEPYKITIFENGSHIGVMGCSTLIENSKGSGRNLVFDFGQTNIKRVLIKKNGKGTEDISNMIIYDSIPSINMEEHIKDDLVKNKKARDLHKYLIRVICDTYNKASKQYKLNNEIIISIANYTVGGKLNPVSGGYEKLRYMGENYAKILSDELSGLLHKKITVRLIHDGTAMGLYFSDYDDAICVSLGTAFGIGMPKIKV